MTRIGHVHGRFHPFHREHLDYALWAARDCDRLIVGITNADPSHTAEENADPDRHLPRHNPFRYHERHRMIRATVADAIDIPVAVMPFPINRPDLWDDYAPRDARHYVNVLEDWHEVKADRLRDHGRAVETKRGTRTVSGTDIRRRMAAGEPWTADLPDPVVDVIRDIDGVRRVRELWDDANE